MTTKVMDCDLIVLGAGGSGLVAAVKAADLTGKKVIVLEKSRKPGGASYFAGTMGASGQIKDSTWQKEAGCEVSATTQDITGQWFDWLVSKGGADTFFKVAKPGENPPQAFFMGTKMEIYWPARLEKYRNLPDPSIGPGKMGTFVVDKLVECCQKQGIQILTEARAKKFVADEKGKVTSVIADTKDGQLLINCKACIIAAGGYGASMEKLKKYFPKEFNNTKIHSLCPPYATGDCIDMAEEIGAYVDHTAKGTGSTPAGFYSDSPMHHPYSYSVHSLMNGGSTVSINLDGKRWKNESGMGGASVSLQPGGVAWTIADSDMIETMGKQIEEERSAETHEGRILRKWREELAYEIAIDEEGASGNHAKKADTLAELALKMKIDPRAFVDTIERYNTFCDNGKDLDFGKSAQMLKAIRKPPFYAVFGHRWSQCTKGMNGVAVNTRFEALNAKGEVIQGLYAVGDGSTIFGGDVFPKQSMGPGGGGSNTSKTATAGSAAPSSASGQTAPSAPGGQGGALAGMTAAPGGGQGGAPNGQGSAPGGSGGPSGGMPMMMGGGSQTVDLKSDGSPCNGLGEAFISGYYAALHAAEYLKGL
jgi:fumarate reductase flavoprotein subunit